jgi:hypothetical protein
MRNPIWTSTLDPTTDKIDMSLLNTSTGQQQHKLCENMQKEILALIAATHAASRSICWANVI